MAIRKEDLHKMIDLLKESDKVIAFDFLEFLIERSKSKPDSWQEIDKASPDEDPLTKEELNQLESEEGFVTGEEAKGEFGLQVDLP